MCAIMADGCFEEFFWVADMRVIKKINNNVAVCRDRKGQEIIAFGKGIGFPQMPYDIGLDKIDRTYYHIDSKYLMLLNELPEEVLQFTAEIVDKASMRLKYELNPNLVLTLSDHISFCLKRAKKGIYIQMPLAYELEQNYPEEVQLGKYTIKQMEKRFHVHLDKNEASGIAMSFINARNIEKNPDDAHEKKKLKYEEILDDTVRIIEEYFQIEIERNSFNFARYTSHLMYLVKRVYNEESIISENAGLYESISEEFPKVSECVEQIDRYFETKCFYSLSKEEKLYLIVHINRIISREGL